MLHKYLTSNNSGTRVQTVQVFYKNYSELHYLLNDTNIIYFSEIWFFTRWAQKGNFGPLIPWQNFTL